jgi:hypothetical protein
VPTISGGVGGGHLPPDSLPGSVPRADELPIDLTAAGESLLLALLFLLLAAFPAELFNRTWDENSEVIGRWFNRGGRIGARVREVLAQFWRRRVGIAVFLGLSALLYGFLSPDFGPTSESVAEFIGILGGLAVVILAFELPIARTHRRVLNDARRLRVLPVTLFVAAVCVLGSRLANFEPGYIYGLVAGYVFAGEFSLRDEARSYALTGTWMLVIALAAWLAMPWVEDSLSSQPLLQMGISAGLATMFVAGLEGVVFGFIPLRFLRGAKLYEWRRSVWAVIFVAAAFLFAYILLDPTPRQHQGVAAHSGGHPVRDVRSRLIPVLGLLPHQTQEP